MRVLLDTHVLLWLIGQPERVPDDVRAQLADRRNQVLVSAISALEIATKTRLGRLHPLGLVEGWSAQLAGIGADELPVRADHALHAGSMSWDHRDPFDRVLVSQALIDGLTFVTVDRVMVDLPAPRIVSW